MVPVSVTIKALRRLELAMSFGTATCGRLIPRDEQVEANFGVADYPL